jgi:four helix bundle protein
MKMKRSVPDLVARTRTFALEAIRFSSGLPRENVAQVLGRQLIRSATSVGAQYREAQRAKSISDFISKAEGALQELDETAYWLELMEGAGIGSSSDVGDLHAEAEQLVAIFVAITRNAKQTRKAG